MLVLFMFVLVISTNLVGPFSNESPSRITHVESYPFVIGRVLDNFNVFSH